MQSYPAKVNFSSPAPRVNLSTWGEAIVAAATGNAVRMGELLSGKDVDGRGVDLRTFRTSWDDVDYLWHHCHIRIDANFTLVEIALERDHCDVVMLLTYEPEPDPAAAPPPLHRAISTFVAPRQGEVNLADAVRDAAFATLSVRPPGDTLAGLPQLHLTHRQTFLLAREAVELPLEGRQAACGSITEDSYTQEGIDDAVAWWAQSLGHALGEPPEQSLSATLPPWGLHPLYTSGDGNCLLHALLLATLGVRDTRLPADNEPGASTQEELQRRAPRRSLRAALHHCIVHCEPMRALLAYHGAVLEPASPGVDTVESRSVLHGNSCDPAHVLALAHIFRRPIVCYAAARVGEVRELDASSTTMSQYAASGSRMSGIYLPCLLRPDECASRDPILIAYSPGHFSALCSTELAGEQRVWRALGLDVPTPDPVAPGAASRGAASSPGSIPVPLVDETLAPLPVLFPPITAPADSISMERLMGSYLDLYLTTPIGPPGRAPQPITITRQRIPPPSDEVLDASPADAYYSAVWQRRVSAAAEPREPRDPERVRRAPSASHNNEAWQA